MQAAQYIVYLPFSFVRFFFSADRNNFIFISFGFIFQCHSREFYLQYRSCLGDHLLTVLWFFYLNGREFRIHCHFTRNVDTKWAFGAAVHISLTCRPNKWLPRQTTSNLAINDLLPMWWLLLINVQHPQNDYISRREADIKLIAQPHHLEFISKTPRICFRRTQEPFVILKLMRKLSSELTLKW